MMFKSACTHMEYTFLYFYKINSCTAEVVASINNTIYKSLIKISYLATKRTLLFRLEA